MMAGEITFKTSPNLNLNLNLTQATMVGEITSIKATQIHSHILTAMMVGELYQLTLTITLTLKI